ncbi:MAG: phosphohydrolase [Candidatus Nephthysia bennettiae]|uniref:HD domain-containing protein n=1 Tax=Candidatus Nephthysia bennettiae TaxID=3127016 RepID=A0A934K8C6_9BACT|nr:HD domain-containing protein [Candidatus Dormibacteraeota bacterium]PZR99773.1 MAG: phosphohydrolase [Candidatus Dormibacteraeota bacterium]
MALGLEPLRLVDVSTVGWAANEATRFLSPLGDRWNHVQGVVTKAHEVASVVAEVDAPVLIASAYLHDVGWAPQLMETEFHPIDGARWLRRLGYLRIAALVAHHSGARFEAALRGLATEIGEFEYEESVVADGLTYCDLTTGPKGQRVSFEERCADIRHRYGETHVAAIALDHASPTLLGAVHRTERRMQGRGGPGLIRT